MISEWSFPDEFLRRVYIPFDNEIRIGGDFYLRLGDALDELHLFFTKETGQHVFVYILRQRGRSAVGIGRIAAKGDGNRHFPASLFVFGEMTGADLVFVPMHAGERGAEELHPVHTDIAG